MPAFTFGPKAAPPAPVVTARAKRMVIDITPSSDNERVSCEVRRYASATDAANDEQLITGIGGSPYLTGGGQYLRTPATYQKRWADVVELRVTDHDDLTDGSEYFYAIFETDEFGNRSLTSATDSAVYRLVETADLTPDAVTPSILFPCDRTNLVRDPEMVEVANHSVSGATTLERFVPADPASWGPGRFGAKISNISATTVEFVGTKDTPVEAGVEYNVSIYGVELVATPLTSVELFVEWYQTDIDGNPSTLISTSIVATDSAKTLPRILSGSVTAPALSQVARYGVKYVFSSIGVYTPFLYVASPRFSRKLVSADYKAGSVGENALAATAYTRSRILGTVSQSGGVPTGAIIEHGSNSNGYYTKFADGTMICRFVDGGTLDSNTASGSGFVSSASGTWTFPVAFINTDDTVVTGQVNGLNRWVSFGAPGTTSVLYRHNSFVTSSSGVVTRLQAVGRWF